MQKPLADFAPMNDTDLRLFLRLAETLSFSRTAEIERIDASRVSRAISALEQKLGKRLFQRSTRSVALTEAGQQFRLSATLILTEWDKATASSVKPRESGRVVIACSHAYASHRLLPLWPALRQRFPDIDLHLEQSDAEDDLIAKGIDLSIRHAPALNGDLIARKLHDTSYGLYAAPTLLGRQHALRTPDQLVDWPHLALTISGFGDTWALSSSDGGKTSLATRPVLTLSSPATLLAACEAGYGIAPLADWLAQTSLKSGKLHRVLPDYHLEPSSSQAAAWLIYPSRHYQSPAVRSVIKWLAAHLSKVM